jgi:hypothetical protein
MKKQLKTTSIYTLDSMMTTDSTTDKTMKANTTPQRSTPDYYKGDYLDLEAFDVVMDFARDSYNIGVAIAYLLRAGKKLDNPKAQDIQKAIDHLKVELQYERDYPQTTEDHIAE